MQRGAREDPQGGARGEAKSLAKMEEETFVFPDKLRLPDEFAKLLDDHDPCEVTLCEAGGGRRLWDVAVVRDGDDQMYLELGWEQVARAHNLGFGNALVFCYGDDAMLTVKVLDVSMRRRFYQHDDTIKKDGARIWDDTGSGSSSDRSSSAEISIHDAPTLQFTVTQKKCSPLGVRRLQQYLSVPPEPQDACVHEERSKVLLRMPGRKSRPVNLKRSIILFTIAALICTIAAPATASGPLLGGWQQIPDINTTEVQEIAGWAVAEHARQANDGLQLKTVMSGMEQVVAGMNWKLRLDAVNGDGVECIYVAEVSDQSWTNTRTLLFFAPAQSAQGMCGLNRPPNSMAPQIRPRFLGLVASCALLLFTAVQFH